MTSYARWLNIKSMWLWCR